MRFSYKYTLAVLVACLGVLAIADDTPEPTGRLHLLAVFINDLSKESKDSEDALKVYMKCSTRKTVFSCIPDLLRCAFQSLRPVLYHSRSEPVRALKS